MNDIKIIRLPDKCDPNKIMRERIEEMYRACPFCNNEGEILRTTSWYGKDHTKSWFRRLFDKRNRWRIDHYYCDVCGAAWDTPAYPADFWGSSK